MLILFTILLLYLAWKIFFAGLKLTFSLVGIILGILFLPLIILLGIVVFGIMYVILPLAIFAGLAWLIVAGLKRV